MLPYSADTLIALKEAGWYEGRQIDPEPYVTSLTERGFEVNEAAVRFFVEFGGLSLYYPPSNPISHRSEACFDVLQPLELPQNVKHWADYFGRQLCLIGACDYYRDTALMITEDGAVYGSTDGWFALYGVSGADMIEGLCIESHKENIPIWDWPENVAKYEAKRAAIHATYVTDDWVKESQDRIDKEVTEYMASKATSKNGK